MLYMQASTNDSRALLITPSHSHLNPQHDKPGNWFLSFPASNAHCSGLCKRSKTACPLEPRFSYRRGCQPLKRRSGYLLPKTLMIMRPHVFLLPTTTTNPSPSIPRKQPTRSDKNNRLIPVPDPKHCNISNHPRHQRPCDAYTYICWIIDREKREIYTRTDEKEGKIPNLLYFVSLG